MEGQFTTSEWFGNAINTNPKIAAALKLRKRRKNRLAANMAHDACSSNVVVWKTAGVSPNSLN